MIINYLGILWEEKFFFSNLEIFSILLHRYDRQLRLWGDHGQSSLEKSKVCLIGATATATEILKSLVLPGVGRFTIVDGKKVTAEDIGNNFFLERGKIIME